MFLYTNTATTNAECINLVLRVSFKETRRASLGNSIRSAGFYRSTTY